MLNSEHTIKLDWLVLLSNAFAFLLVTCFACAVRLQFCSLASWFFWITNHISTNWILIVLDSKDNRITLLDLHIYVRMSHKHNFYDFSHFSKAAVQTMYIRLTTIQNKYVFFKFDINLALYFYCSFKTAVLLWRHVVSLNIMINIDASDWLLYQLFSTFCKTLCLHLTCVRQYTEHTSWVAFNSVIGL